MASRLAGLTAQRGRPVSGAIARSLIAGLLAAQDEQAGALEGVPSQIEPLAGGPWQTARLYLREALVPGQPGQVTAALQRAAAQLLTAVALQPPDSLQQAQVLADVMIVQQLLGDTELAARHAGEAYWTARRAMGRLVWHEFGGRLPARPDNLARLSLAGAVYDAIEWAAAAAGDPAAGQVFSAGDQATGQVFSAGDGETGLCFDPAGVTWTSDGDLDFAYLAYFQLLMDRARSVEAVGPAATTSQRVLVLRFGDQDRVSHPRHPPLPPPALLAEPRVVLRELQLLAVTGRL